MPKDPDYIEVDNDNDKTSFSASGYLRKAFKDELGNDNGLDHKLLVIAVHAVLSESGFIRFDPIFNREIHLYQFRNVWPSSAFRMSLWYTLPEVTDHHRGNNVFDHVVLKFQSLGKFLNVYGSLANGSSSSVTYWARLDEEKLAPLLKSVRENCGTLSKSLLKSVREKQVLDCWTLLKERIVLPLWIDLRKKSGFGLQQCFICLPSDLKLKIFESLSGFDLAMMACVCVEFRCLSSQDYLWRMKFKEQFGKKAQFGDYLWTMKFKEQFGEKEGLEGEGNWKEMFVECRKSMFYRALPRRRACTNLLAWASNS